MFCYRLITLVNIQCYTGYMYICFRPSSLIIILYDIYIELSFLHLFCQLAGVVQILKFVLKVIFLATTRLSILRLVL